MVEAAAAAAVDLAAADSAAVVDSAVDSAVVVDSADILAADSEDMAHRVLEAIAEPRRAHFAGRAVSTSQDSAAVGSIKEWATSLPRQSRVA